MSIPNVNDKFFLSSYQDVWRTLSPEGLTSAEVDLIMDVGSLSKDSKVLDIMCGYGRHAVGLSKRGVHVTAVDNLQTYIDEITNEARKEALPITPICSNILDFSSNNKFSAVICMGNSFGFFDPGQVKLLIEKVSSLLIHGGVMIINSWMIAEVALKYFKERDWHYGGEYKCVLEYKYEFCPPRIISKQTIISPNNSIEVLDGVDYIYSLYEISQMFSNVGMVVENVYSTPRKRRFQLGDVTSYITIRKLSV